MAVIIMVVRYGPGRKESRVVHVSGGRGFFVDSRQHMDSDMNLRVRWTTRIEMRTVAASTIASDSTSSTESKITNVLYAMSSLSLPRIGDF